jgi:hypothetical protein
LLGSLQEGDLGAIYPLSTLGNQLG